MVVDAIDLSYSKSHIDTFVLRHRRQRLLAARVEAQGERQARHRLRRAQLDVRSPRQQLRRVHLLRRSDPCAEAHPAAHAAAPQAEEGGRGESETTDGTDKRKQEAFERLVATVTSLETDYDPVWGSLVKQTVKRVYPGFNESYYGYTTFADLLEDAAKEGAYHARARRAARQLSSPLGPLTGPCSTRSVVARRRGFDTSVTAPRRTGAETTGSTKVESEVVYVPAGVDGGQGRRASHPRHARRRRSRAPTLFLRLWRVTEGKRMRTRATLFMVRPGVGDYVIKELIPDMELDAQAALDKAVAIAKRGDTAVVYLNADIARIPKSRSSLSA